MSKKYKPIVTRSMLEKHYRAIQPLSAVLPLVRINHNQDKEQQTMTILNRQWTEIEPGYFVLDMTYCVLYCTKTDNGYRWERLYRVAGELVDDDCRMGSCKLRHHAATSAIRSVLSAEALRLNYCFRSLVA